MRMICDDFYIIQTVGEVTGVSKKQGFLFEYGEFKFTLHINEMSGIISDASTGSKLSEIDRKEIGGDILSEANYMIDRFIKKSCIEGGLIDKFKSFTGTIKYSMAKEAFENMVHGFNLLERCKE